ncbi:CCA tRNA nucleotidyltransferase [candidate division WOR-3 bacterium]|nr:CCA tRNA nucleotidyltransferase [candidate division WOR-3 bacterium]
MEILKKIEGITTSHNVKVYTVGGPVRDYLLGNSLVDKNIDITVEGDGIAFGKLLQKEMGGKLNTHLDFGTCSLILPNATIDIASCRKEKYARPAKLPEVEKTTLLEDLKRRDFTINAMAIEMSKIKNQKSNIIDPFGGMSDLKNGLIRVLHPKSFIDDPTRIFRALRFAGKFDFRLESETDILAKKAIKAGLVEKLSPKRIRRETILILEEQKRERIIRLSDKFGLLKILKLKLPEPGLFKKLEATTYPSLANKWFVYLLGILDLENPSPFLSFTNKELQKIKHTNTILKNLHPLKNAKKPSEIYNLLKEAGDEELLFIMLVVSQVKSRIIKFLQVYKKVKLKINGKDLIKLGIKEGPLYKELLSATLYAKLDGMVRTKKEELEFAKKYSKDNS